MGCAVPSLLLASCSGLPECIRYDKTTSLVVRLQICSLGLRRCILRAVSGPWKVYLIVFYFSGFENFFLAQIAFTTEDEVMVPC